MAVITRLEAASEDRAGLRARCDTSHGMLLHGAAQGDRERLQAPMAHRMASGERPGGRDGPHRWLRRARPGLRAAGSEPRRTTSRAAWPQPLGWLGAPFGWRRPPPRLPIATPKALMSHPKALTSHPKALTSHPEAPTNHPQSCPQPTPRAPMDRPKAPMDHPRGSDGAPRRLRLTTLRGADDHPKGSPLARRKERFARKIGGFPEDFTCVNVFAAHIADYLASVPEERYLGKVTALGLGAVTRANLPANPGTRTGLSELRRATRGRCPERNTMRPSLGLADWHARRPESAVRSACRSHTHAHRVSAAGRRRRHASGVLHPGATASTWEGGSTWKLRPGTSREIDA